MTTDATPAVLSDATPAVLRSDAVGVAAESAFSDLVIPAIAQRAAASIGSPPSAGSAIPWPKQEVRTAMYKAVSSVILGEASLGEDELNR